MLNHYLKSDQVLCAIKLLIAFIIISIWILILSGCIKSNKSYVKIKLEQNPKIPNLYEGQFKTDENHNYIFSIIKPNKKKLLNENDKDTWMIKNPQNKLFISEFITDSMLISLNDMVYSCRINSHSSIQLIPTLPDSVHGTHLFILNDTVPITNLHDYVQNNTESIQEVIKRADSDSILVYIWETRCPPCIRDIDQFKNMESGNLKIIHLCLSDELESASEFMSKKSYKPFYEGYIDITDKQKLYCIGFPTKYFVNRSGYITKYLF